MAALVRFSGLGFHGELSPGDRVVGDAKNGINTTHSQDAGQQRIRAWLQYRLGFRWRLGRTGAIGSV
jgi:hypothetical protein